MPFVRVTEFTHAKIREEIDTRKDAGECPRPTFESIIHEMTVERVEKSAKRKKAA